MGRRFRRACPQIKPPAEFTPGALSERLFYLATKPLARLSSTGEIRG